MFGEAAMPYKKMRNLRSRTVISIALVASESPKVIWYNRHRTNTRSRPIAPALRCTVIITRRPVYYDRDAVVSACFKHRHTSDCHSHHVKLEPFASPNLHDCAHDENEVYQNRRH